jgi:hypothetical protein
MKTGEKTKLSIETMEDMVANYIGKVGEEGFSIDDAKVMANLVGKGLKTVVARMEYEAYKAKGGKSIGTMER